MKYAKYHALGNDYLVITPTELGDAPDINVIRMICHRNYGIGSDGILLGPLESTSCDFGLRILNPDGSEAEKSGNGLRIFARFLWDEDLVGKEQFTVETLGGEVSCAVSHDGMNVTVKMGTVVFDRLNETVEIGDHSMTFCGASVGNPHCVVLSDDPTPEIAWHYGPIIEVDSRFPNRTNVQFMSVIDRNSIQIEIWERGAGYTLASGSSSTAAAAVAHKLNLCDSNIIVHMQGGQIEIQLNEAFGATMKGPVTKVCDGDIADEMFNKIGMIRYEEKR